jgi:hypothetical protein
VPPFGIPPAYRDSFTKLAKLPQEDAGKLVDAICELAAFQPVSSIEQATASVLGSNATPAEKRLALPLLALRGQLRQRTTAEIAEQLSESLDLELDDDDRVHLKERAGAILASAVFSSTGVATDLQTQNARNFQSARIITDLRPVFQDVVAKDPDGAVIVETLQMQTWTRDGGTDLVFVSMDESDLRQLRSIIDRALEKTDTLKRFIAEKDLAYFELEGEAADE